MRVGARIGLLTLFLVGSGYAYLHLAAVPLPSFITTIEAPKLHPFEEERKSLLYLNTLRVQAGMSSFLENQHLKQSAKSHADYLVQHQKIGHFEDPSLSGFTGETPTQRVVTAGYKSALSIENVSNDVIGYKASVEGLFSAIYHRFGFLDFQVDEIGVGMAQSSTYHAKTAYVYNMGIYEVNDLCNGVSYQGAGAYTYHICADANFRIKKSYFDEAYNACYKRNKKVVIYPFSDQEDVPPAFYNELPDPLPEYSVSGFPISIQFNPYYFKIVKLKRFELFRGNRKIEKTKIYDHISDINALFKRNEFALFPLERLEWDSRYRVEVEYLVGDKHFTKKWYFKTKQLSSTPIMIDKDKMEVEISHKGETILYFKPRHADDILGNIQYDAKLEISFIDNNTLKIETEAEVGEAFTVYIAGREIRLLVGD